MQDYTPQLQKIIDLQQQIQHLHAYLEKLYPIAIVQEDQFLIYDFDLDKRSYTFVKSAPTPMPIPAGVRAAFPLESYDSRMVCVVTGDVFDDLGGYVTIFHEFVHCQQSERCEARLKRTLGVAQKALATNDYMWEINHPFPYTRSAFVQLYTAFLHSDDLADLVTIREQLKALLDMQDYEYLVWQEWKEGFARFIENRMKQFLGLPLNQGGRQAPFSRVSFYAGGAHFIAVVVRETPDIVLSLEPLFEAMLNRTVIL